MRLEKDGFGANRREIDAADDLRFMTFRVDDQQVQTLREIVSHDAGEGSAGDLDLAQHGLRLPLQEFAHMLLVERGFTQILQPLLFGQPLQELWLECPERQRSFLLGYGGVEELQAAAPGVISLQQLEDIRQRLDEDPLPAVPDDELPHGIVAQAVRSTDLYETHLPLRAGEPIEPVVLQVRRAMQAALHGLQSVVERRLPADEILDQLLHVVPRRTGPGGPCCLFYECCTCMSGVGSAKPRFPLTPAKCVLIPSRRASCRRIRPAMEERRRRLYSTTMASFWQTSSRRTIMSKIEPAAAFSLGGSC